MNLSKVTRPVSSPKRIHTPKGSPADTPKGSPAAEKHSFLKASSSGDLGTVQQLSKFVDVNTVDSHGKSALMSAAESVIKQLVKSKKVKLNEKDDQGWTALHYASVEGHLDVVMYLVKKGHDPNSRNADRTSCLHYLVRHECNEKLKKTINLLLKHGAQIDSKNKFDLTPLQAAASRGKVAVVQFLLTKKANINARNKFGDSALWMAVVTGNTEMVKLLVESGANPTFKSEGQYGDMIKTAYHFGYNEIGALLEDYTQQWLFKNVASDPADDQWKVLSPVERLQNSPVVDLSKLTSKDQATAIVERIQRHIVKDFSGWIVEEGILQVPKVPVKHDFDAPVSEYNRFFVGKTHFNFVGTQILGKDVEPLIISVATYEEIDGEYRTVLWTIRGTSYMTIPTDLINAADLQGSCKKLVSYMRAFFEEKYSHQGIKPVTVKLEPVPASHHNMVEEDLRKFETNDPQMPCQMSIGVIYCKEGQKEEEEYFQNDHDDASPEYKQFLKILGQEIVLEGHDGYRGDLDVSGKNLSGEKSIMYQDEKFSIMYHVSTMLPRSVAEEEEQQIRRKRHIGNDITTIVFQEKGYFQQLVRSQFLHNYIVVSPVDIGGVPHYKVSVVRQEDVPEYKPTLCVPAVLSATHLGPFLTSKTISAQWAALRSPKLAPLLSWKVKHIALGSIVQSCK